MLSWLVPPTIVKPSADNATATGGGGGGEGATGRYGALNRALNVTHFITSVVVQRYNFAALTTFRRVPPPSTLFFSCDRGPDPLYFQPFFRHVS